MNDDDTKVSYSFVNELLEKYYKEKYPEYSIKGICQYTETIDEDYIHFYEFAGEIIISKEATVAGKTIMMIDSIVLSDDEMSKLLKKIFQNELDKKEKGIFTVKEVYPKDKGVYISVNIKNKELIKKGE